MTTAIDPQFVDVGISNMPAGYLASAIPRIDSCGSHFMVYEDEFPIHPRSEWDALIEEQEELELLSAETKDQKQEGSCCPNATGGMFEILWNMTFGIKCWVQFSPISLYRWLSPGPSSGVYIPASLKQLCDVGMLPTDTPRNRAFLEHAGLDPTHVLQPTGYSQPFPSKWKETAFHFRLAEAWDIRTFDGIASSLLDKFAVVYGRAGHAICGVKTRKQSGVYLLRYLNSWNGWGETGANGNRGFGHDTERYVSGAVQGYGAFAGRSPVITDVIRKAVETFRWEN